MSRDNDNGWVGTVSAFAIGIGVGAALGLLFAPKAGDELRGDLADNAKQGLDQAVSKGREWAGRAQQAAGDAMDQARNKVQDTVNQAKNQVQDTVNQAQNTANQAGQAYREASNSGA